MNLEDKLDAIFDALPRNTWALRSLEEGWMTEDGVEYDTLSYTAVDDGINELYCFTPDWYEKPLEYRKLDLLSYIYQGVNP